MGELAARTIFSNDTGPLAGTGLDTLAKNQGAILELEGAQAPQSKTITDGSISPTAAYVIVDTEGSAPADDLEVISPVLSASENLHDGMVLYLKAADSGRVVTVKNSSSANGINTYDGNDYVLSTTHWLKLQLRSGKWYEVEGRAMETALAAASAAATAATAADHAQTKSGTSSTASGTAAKVVTCSGFELSDQARIFVTFSNANTVADALTLNVNGTGAKSVYNQTGIISTSNTALFAANQPIEFRYDGTGWVFVDISKANVILQQVRYQTSSFVSTTSTVPMDGTIPQITEGVQVMSLSVTPKYTTSRFEVKAHLNVACSAPTLLTAAIFKDSSPDAVAVSTIAISANDGFGEINPINSNIQFGDTNEHHISVNFGPRENTGYFNGSYGTQYYGTAFVSSLIITEFAA
jgi:hypothetical protein|nr:MAG TPA: hypothetical protein [Bacteriophage sp.]